MVRRDHPPALFHSCSTLEELFGLLKIKYRPSRSVASTGWVGSTTGTAPRLYDEFMPFGPLSKDVLQRALDILNKVARELNKAPSGLPPDDELLAKLVKLQSEYHTLVPQPLGIGLQGKLARPANHSMIIVNNHIIRVQGLLGANKHVPSSSSSKIGRSKLNPTYSCKCPKGLNNLLLDTLEALPVGGGEYNEIATYFYNTLYRWQGKVAIMHIFRIDRQGEAERWAAVMKGKLGRTHDNRRMLWHGSPVRNFESILKDGLKIVRMSEIFFSDIAGKR